MEDIGTIILNSISEEKPLYYVVKEYETNWLVGIVETKFNEDCVSLIEKCILAYTNAESIIDIEFENGDDESFACFEISYMQGGEQKAKSFYFEVVEFYK
jgi:hypothetical protein